MRRILVCLLCAFLMMVSPSLAQEASPASAARLFDCVPIVRLQKLLGHATPAMTIRYMKRAPEAYLDQDAAAVCRAIRHSPVRHAVPAPRARAG